MKKSPHPPPGNLSPRKRGREKQSALNNLACHGVKVVVVRSSYFSRYYKLMVYLRLCVLVDCLWEHKLKALVSVYDFRLP